MSRGAKEQGNRAIDSSWRETVGGAGGAEGLSKGFREWKGDQKGAGKIENSSKAPVGSIEKVGNTEGRGRGLICWRNTANKIKENVDMR